MQRNSHHCVLTKQNIDDAITNVNYTIHHSTNKTESTNRILQYASNDEYRLQNIFEYIQFSSRKCVGVCIFVFKCLTSALS